MIDLSMLSSMPLPSQEEMEAGARQKYELVGKYNIDQWPQSVRDLSMPTALIEVDPEDFSGIWNEDESSLEVMKKYATILDDHMGWTEHFVKLNSRSPKDSAYPGLPITCSGKQAMIWFVTSERVCDDTSLARLSKTPFYIALRQREPIQPMWEVRAYAKYGKVLGASRYNYEHPPTVCLDTLWPSVQKFYEDHLKDHYDTVVFDLAYGVRSGDPLLIELNPYGLSDPCCFGSYENIETLGGFRNERCVG